MMTINGYVKIAIVFFLIKSVTIIQAQQLESFTDKRDGKIYKTVKIGTQIWMVENLNVDKFRNGDLIPNAKIDEEWIAASYNNLPLWCFYENDLANGIIYGKLYNWYAVTDPRGLCPKGWHVPSDTDWSTLTDLLGDEARDKMKSISGWDYGGNGNNKSGFSGLPGGARGGDVGFLGIGRYGGWWSSTEIDTNISWFRNLSYGSGLEVGRYSTVKGVGFSVRCIRD